MSSSERRSSSISSVLKSATSFGCAQPTYFIRTNNGYNLVDPIFQALGWRRLPCTSSSIECARFRWTELSNQINYNAFREGEQQLNHFPNNGLISNKLGLLMCLRQYEQQFKNTKNRLPNLLLKDIIPETYVVSDIRERDLFTKAFKPGTLWINKPTGMNQGKGIFLVRDIQSFLDNITTREKEYTQLTIPRSPMPRIAQRYIENPLLLDGRKFDIRSFMVVANSYPYLVLYHPGYVRLSIQKYSKDDTNLATHLTNQFIQKKEPMYYRVYEDTVWSMSQLNDYVNEHYSDKVNPNWVHSVLELRMQRVMAHVFNSVRNKLASREGLFEIFGFDFMIDEDFKIWLIEVNTNPAMHTNCTVLNKVLPPIIEKSIYVVVECFERLKKKRSMLPLQGIIPWNEQNSRRRSMGFEDKEDAGESCIDAAKIHNWVRNPYNGLPSGFVVLFNENFTIAQIRASQTMTIPLRAWVCPRFYISSTPKVNKVAVESSSDEEGGDTSYQIMNNRRNIFHKPSNFNNQDTQLVGIRSRCREKPKTDVVPYKEKPFEHILRKYPTPPSRRRSEPCLSESSGSRPITSNNWDRRVSEVYQSSVEAKEESPKSEPLPRPIRQNSVNKFLKPKKELPTRVPFQMTTVQVVTNGNPNLPTTVDVQYEEEYEVPTMTSSQFPKRTPVVRNALGYNIVQLLDGSADLGLRLKRDSIVRRSLREDNTSKENNEAKLQVFVDRSC
ncbi:Tubulin tyrosine ligase-like, member 10 [Cichlidogyrus casuarinus]|uniref:Tubulin tyrosine ligase-like, member 10 n=1 Tax=Cichlidogyrus casuarinus TaxID=1844966 RepID=A0ABD2QJ32_9PLAT